MKNAIFTIVAKNYFSSAITLGKSVKRCVPDCDFIVILCDENDGEIELQDYEFEVVIANKMGIPGFEKMSFLYDVVELATSIKPFTFLYLMEEKGYERMLYLDPDIWVMDSLDSVFEKLDDVDFLLTPHIVDIDICSKKNKEEHILNRGVFNLGFLGVRNSSTAYPFLNWWKNRLSTSCFRDSVLFVDQKWVDYLPVFSSNYEVIRSKAYNIADWNYHERQLKKMNEKNYVLEKNGSWESIKFFHFSGIKLGNVETYLERFNVNNEEQKEVLKKLIVEYQNELVINQFERFSVMNYHYNFYENGDRIELLHRRIYRELLKRGINIENPYRCDKNGKLYKLLNGKSRIKIGANPISHKEKAVRFFLKAIRKVMGDKQYQINLAGLRIYTDIDNQIFLIE